MLELNGLYKVFNAGTVNEKRAIDGLDLTLEEGDFVTVIGGSGAGKSTMLNLLGGIDRADEGEILVAGEDIAKLSEKELSKYRAKRVGFVFQFYNLIPTLTVKENVELMRELKKDALEAGEALRKIGLSGHEKKFPEQLSGGEQQRVSIARAIAKNPDILLCDEPTGALDSETGCMVLSELQKLCRSEGKTVLVVTHNANIARAADRVIHIRSGEIKSIECCDDPCSVEEVEW